MRERRRSTTAGEFRLPRRKARKARSTQSNPTFVPAATLSRRRPARVAGALWTAGGAEEEQEREDERSARVAPDRAGASTAIGGLIVGRIWVHADRFAPVQGGAVVIDEAGRRDTADLGPVGVGVPGGIVGREAH